jgi:YbbR domain-containing protein
MQRNRQKNRVLLNNLIWFLASFAMAFLVWIIATVQADPIQERRLTQQIPIQIEPEPGLVIVEQNTRNAVVTIRAQQSVISALTMEDVIVRADLSHLGPGKHTVPLETVLARRAVADTQPRQITVTLEELQAQQVDVTYNIINEPPASYELGDVVFDQPQVMVSGATSRVQQVVTAQVALDLSNQRAPLETALRLIPIDADGDTVPDVVLEPQTIGITVNITRREGVREVFVTPNIDISSLPEGYILSSIAIEPQTVLVLGSPEELASIPDTLFTDRIQLTGRTSDFEVVVPVMFPDDPLPLLGDQIITVSISITAQTATRQFDNIPVSTIGLDDDLQAQFVPEQVAVLVSGPQNVLGGLQSEDVHVVLDLNGLEPGTYDLSPVVSVNQGGIDPQDITALPASVNVTIRFEVEATATPPP